MHAAATATAPAGAPTCVSPSDLDEALALVLRRRRPLAPEHAAPDESDREPSCISPPPLQCNGRAHGAAAIDDGPQLRRHLFFVPVGGWRRRVR